MIRTTLFALALTTSAAAFAQAGAVQSIPRAKVVANAEAEFKEVDVNKDGQMTRAEIETFQLNSIMAAAAARNKAMFGELDTNKDGKISLAEHRSATLATFTQMDANKDGTLTTAEVSAVLQKK